jgi:hypothetical protein
MRIARCLSAGLAFSALAHATAFAACPPNASSSYVSGSVVHCKCDAGYENLNGACAAMRYQPSGNGLVGGTKWLLGYNVQTTDPAVVARAREMLKKQMELAGVQYDEKIDFDRYNFVLGIAISTKAFIDLPSRVLLDQFLNGQFTADQQTAYASLKGRSFNELACHSNGAMICLAALARKDVTAKHVVLYGPQITPDSLRMWDQLVRSGQVGSVEMRVNQGDLVPPLSFLLSNPAAVLDVVFHPFLSVPLFIPGVLNKAVKAFAPSIEIKTASCSAIPNLNCHEMAVYTENRAN